LNPITTTPPNNLPDVAEVYFHDGRTMGPMIALATVGDELPELLVGALDALADQGIDKPSIGNFGAMLAARAVYTGNIVSLNPSPPRGNYGAQISMLHQREYAPGGIGVVLIDVGAMLITTYGGRGFPEVHPCNPYTPTSFLFEKLRECTASGIDQAPKSVNEVKAAPKKKAAKKAAKKKATRKVVVE